MSSEWLCGWPTTPGAYWFYGRRTRALERGTTPLLLLACVRNDGGILEHYIVSPSGSHLMDPADYHGLWQPIPAPELPGVGNEP